MAPELALDKIDTLTEENATVLDPMCGSGTVPHIAVQQGRHAIACDLDPLAVLITRVACKPGLIKDLTKRAKRVVQEAKMRRTTLPRWIADDDETAAFAEYWFGDPQRAALSQIAKVLAIRPGGDDALRIALSRIIVTKEGGASLARDTSHSRPHRVRLSSDYDVVEGFLESASKIEKLLKDERRPGSASVRSVDARSLGFLPRGSVDLTVTSPPYLNAIDYLRGHRLSLVWLGWNMPEIRRLRGDSIGAERGLAREGSRAQQLAQSVVPQLVELPNRDQRMIRRYAVDVDRLCRSVARVTKPGGYLVFVVADSQLKSVPIFNSHFCKVAALSRGFEFVEGVTRALPGQHRYLPPPENESGSLGGRMREESVLTFRKLPVACL
jgi:DNA modification methylase